MVLQGVFCVGRGDLFLCFTQTVTVLCIHILVAFEIFSQFLCKKKLHYLLRSFIFNRIALFL